MYAYALANAVYTHTDTRIVDVTSHGKICPQINYNAKPKNVKNSVCIHIFTKERTYHLLTDESAESEPSEGRTLQTSISAPTLSSSGSVPTRSPSNISVRSSSSEFVDWPTILKSVLRVYKVKKNARLVLRKDQGSVGRSSIMWDTKGM